MAMGNMVVLQCFSYDGRSSRWAPGAVLLVKHLSLRDVSLGCLPRIRIEGLTLMPGEVTPLRFDDLDDLDSRVDRVDCAS